MDDTADVGLATEPEDPPPGPTGGGVTGSLGGATYSPCSGNETNIYQLLLIIEKATSEGYTRHLK